MKPASLVRTMSRVHSPWLPVILLYSALCLLPCPGATNDLSSLLQKGLFEEEANRNLPAAIEAYETLTHAFDQDRRLAATALFRLGECHRKLGQTNEAAAAYQRILAEFGEEETLATLSRQNLAGMGMRAASAVSGTLSEEEATSMDARAEQRRLLEEERDLIRRKQATQQELVASGRISTADLLETQQELLAIERRLVALSDRATTESQAGFTPSDEATQLAAQLAGIEALEDDPEDQARAVLALFPDEDLKAMLLHLPRLQHQEARIQPDQTNKVITVHAIRGSRPVQDLLVLEADQSPRGPAAARAETQKQLTYIAERVEFILGVQQARLKALQFVALTPASGKEDRALLDRIDAVPDEQEQEIARLQAMIRNSPDLINAPSVAGVAGATPLAAAASKGQLRVARFLLDHGAVVDQRSSSGDPYAKDAPALHHAAAAGHRAMVELLLERGANVDARAEGGATALHVAAQKGFQAVAEALLAGGSDINVRDHGQSTPLHFAARQGHAAMTAFLLRNGADPNAQDDAGMTPLIRAAGVGNLAVTKHLLDAEADPDIQDNSGQTALGYAAGSGHLDIVEALLAAKADPNAGKMNLPLHGGIRKNRADIVKALLVAGADPNLRDDAGQTPLDLTAGVAGAGSFTAAPPAGYARRGWPPGGSKSRSRNSEVADLLRKHGASQDLPDWKSIRIMRPGWDAPWVLINTEYQGSNEFSFYEVLGMMYHFLDTSPGGSGSKQRDRSDTLAMNSSFVAFPDLQHVRILRPGLEGEEVNETRVDAAAMLESADCGHNVTVRLGDVVEIPETDHPLNVRWRGLTPGQLKVLQQCLTRSIEIRIKGKVERITLSPVMEFGARLDYPYVTTEVPFWLKPVLIGSNLLFASSDLSRVKVIRTDPAHGTKREWVVDCADNRNPAVWLRDGDVIEVPERE